MKRLLRVATHLLVLLPLAGTSRPAQANPLTEFAGQMAGEAWSHIETALGQTPALQAWGGSAKAAVPAPLTSANEASHGRGFELTQPGLNPTSPPLLTSSPATALMVSQAGMAALETMRVGASFDLGGGHQEPPAPTTVMAGLSDNQVREAIVRDHLVSYVNRGACLCPNQPDKAGQPCGRRAGYGKTNNNIAVCYTSQVDQRMVWEWRSAHPAGR